MPRRSERHLLLVGVKAHVDGYLYFCVGPEINWQLVLGLACALPCAVQDSSGYHTEITQSADFLTVVITALTMWSF